MRRYRTTDFVVVVTTGLLLLTALAAGQTVSVTTWRNDNLRTGQNLNETVLTPSSLSTFGQLCSYGVDGQVYSQPLVVTGATILGNYYPSAVLVVTQNDTLYAFSGAPPESGGQCILIGSVSLIPAGQYATDCYFVGSGTGSSCVNTIGPYVGILGTPVIGPVVPNQPHAKWPLYAVTETQDTSPVNHTPPANWYHYLHAVDIQSLTEISAPVQINPPGLSSGGASTWSRAHIQRPGLLLTPNNHLYIAFSMMDGNRPLPNGAVFDYDTANLGGQPLYFPTTPDKLVAGGGVWQGGAALAYGPDENGANSIYFNTGNGEWNGTTKWGDSFVKLDPTTLTVHQQSYFTPSDQFYRNCKNPFTDADFGSGGVLLTPANSYWPYIAITGEKEGGIWVMDRLSPGAFNQGLCTADCTQCKPQSQDQSNQNLQTIWLSHGLGPEIHNTPAYWNNSIYLASSGGPLIEYQLCNNYPTGKPFCNNAPVRGTDPAGDVIRYDYGATPSISASSASANGIVWAVRGEGNAISSSPGILHAYDATTLAILYSSSGPGSSCPEGDTMAPSTKFSVPTVANGYVYMGTQAMQNGVNNGTGMFYTFGLNRPCPPQDRRVGVLKHKK